VLVLAVLWGGFVVKPNQAVASSVINSGRLASKSSKNLEFYEFF